MSPPRCSSPPGHQDEGEGDQVCVVEVLGVVEGAQHTHTHTHTHPDNTRVG